MELEKRRFRFTDSKSNDWIAVFTTEHNYLDDYLLKVARNGQEVSFSRPNLYDWADLPEDEQLGLMEIIIEILKRRAENFE